MIFTVSSAASALPNLQLYIDGAGYDHDTETWLIESESQFDLYVVGAIPTGDEMLENVKLVISTDSETEPVGTVMINGNSLPDDGWEFGSPPFPPVFPPHGVFPAWYFVFDMDDLQAIGGVGNAVPDSAGEFFDPSEGYLDDESHLGEIRSFDIDVSGELTNLHFDACMIEEDGRIGRHAPFSHDAAYVDSLFDPPTGIEDDFPVPTKTALLRSYPNPFNAVTTIEFSFSTSSDISLELFDMQGRRVTTLAKGYYIGGEHAVIWDGINDSGNVVASGVYLVRLSTADATITRNVVLLK